MASVRITKELRAGILSKFREALVATTQKNPKIVNLGDKLYDMIHTPLEKEWLQLTTKLLDSYDGSAQRRKNALNIHTAENIYFILCPKQEENIVNKAQDKRFDNLYMLDEWASKANKYSGRSQRNPGEIGVEIPMSSSKPMIVNQSHWHSDYDNQTTIRNGFCIVDEDLLQLVHDFSEGSLRVTDSIDKLDEFLSTCTTLKKFLDEWPGAENLIPEQFLQKMFDKAIKTSANAHADLISKNTLSTDFKKEMNAAILISKLSS